ncbi:MutS domain V [Halovivax ruber XH-70]|uniref:MutS domain V n=1 Tax=Halovivax ruber (strain DSM 18193 / JCM 13892 / XH-70) TaxID=797302 RepID=L0IAA0_HALRX|nr:MutS domain V [Halovivax ruber]AGB16520.1 MutS domain V [Halovivax ruber XH-70]
MRLEEYWGVGPKTRERLVDTLGADRAATAIERGDVRALTDAGLTRGRATHILRRATGNDGMETLATADAREAYKDVLDLVVEHALTERAADRIRILTPLIDPAAMESRLDDVEQAREVWAGLSDDDQRAVLAAYDTYDDRDGTELAAVETAITLAELGVDDGPFEPVSSLDPEALADATTALEASAGDRIQGDVDAELDSLRTALDSLEGLDADTLVSELRDGGVTDVDRFREALEDRLLTETDLTIDRIREAMATDAADAADFVAQTLRQLRISVQSATDEREEAVITDVESTVERHREAIDDAVTAVDEIALSLSLARFADAYDCTRPTFATADDAAISVVEARNLRLAAEADESVQAITYALGTHDVESGPDAAGTPGDERVSVLTGANSGGKTTLLETLCQVTVLASMGLPVPAARAEVTPVDSLVFHRRHASFNAGVLESTLRSIVPPLTDDGKTLMLVDEFEAITEPGRAADLLLGLVTLAVDRDALGVFVTHLAEDLDPLPDAARVDGIFAEGLNPELELRVDYQPRFDTLGRSTPEFIVSRLVANADDRTERVGFETLAEAVGQEIVQRTLADARWTDGSSSTVGE